MCFDLVIIFRLITEMNIEVFWICLPKERFPVGRMRVTKPERLYYYFSLVHTPQANWIKVRRKIFEKFFTYFLFLTEEFWKEMDKAWNSITKEELRKYINTMPDRCKAVIAAKGGHTRYWFYSQTYSLYIKLHL